MSRLVVACVLVKGHVDFTPEYVNKLRSMVRRCAPPDHEFICLTDQPDSLPFIECIRIPTPPAGRYAWWAKLELFNPAHERLRGCRILYLDLDVLLVDTLDPIVNFSHVMAIVPDGAPNFIGKDGLKVVKRFNSSVMCWTAGMYDDLYTHWTPDVAKRLWGDQDWIGEKLEPREAVTMPLAWFPRISQIVSRGKVDKFMSQAKVVLCKRPKNVAAAKQWAWFRKVWC